MLGQLGQSIAATAEEKWVEEAVRKPVTMRFVDGPEPLADKLIELIERLFVEGRKNMVTMSPGQVLYFATLLDRVLVKHEIIPPGDRMKYARALKRKERQASKCSFAKPKG